MSAFRTDVDILTDTHRRVVEIQDQAQALHGHVDQLIKDLAPAKVWPAERKLLQGELKFVLELAGSAWRSMKFAADCLSDSIPD